MVLMDLLQFVKMKPFPNASVFTNITNLEKLSTQCLSLLCLDLYVWLLDTAVIQITKHNASNLSMGR